MRFHYIAFYSSLFLTITFFFTNCKKESAVTNIILYDKPLSTIQSHLQGTWELHYGKGGICATCITDYESNKIIWQLIPSTRIKQIVDNKTIIDTVITWKREIAFFINGDSTYTMNYHDRQGNIYSYVVDGIFNDTLKLHENYVADAVFYYFTKIKE